MAEINEDDQKSENSGDGGETGDQKTTGKSAEELAKIADDQRKRAEIAEGKLKAKEAAEAADKAKKDAEAKKTEEQNKTNNPQPLTPLEQAKLLRPYQDLDETQAEQLEKVVKATGLSPAEAKKDPLFAAWNDKYAEEQKKEKAKLGASQGSGQGTSEDQPEFQPGMKRDDHKSAAAKFGVK